MKSNTKKFTEKIGCPKRTGRATMLAMILHKSRKAGKKPALKGWSYDELLRGE